MKNFAVIKAQCFWQCSNSVLDSCRLVFMPAFVGGAKWKWAVKTESVGKYKMRLNYPVTVCLLGKEDRW